MKISVLCTDETHPVNQHLELWISTKKDHHQVELVRRKLDLSGGDILFLISCTEIVTANERAAYRASLVIHASDLPRGRGWSPHIWRILEGAEDITLSLLEAEDKVDSGRIWKKTTIRIPKHALWNEINDYLFQAELDLMDFAVCEFGRVIPVLQDGAVEPTYYPRRTPLDSRLDSSQAIESQFDKIRVCDPNRFPAYLEMHGKKYKIVLEKLDE